jgi:hypothetical protein|tara:strand:+ start:3527 stop:3652 length:126 start_codon:yes stop_codon:yes gene_type:complete
MDYPKFAVGFKPFPKGFDCGVENVVTNFVSFNPHLRDDLYS